jgi:hypothetical protein
MEEGDGGVNLSELWDAERFEGAASLLWSSSRRNVRRCSPSRSSSSLLFPEPPCFVEKSDPMAFPLTIPSHTLFRSAALLQIIYINKRGANRYYLPDGSSGIDTGPQPIK